MGVIKKYTIGNQIDKLKKIEKVLKELVEYKYNYKWSYDISFSPELQIETKTGEFKSKEERTRYFEDCIKIIDYLNHNNIQYSLYNWNSLDYRIKVDR